MKGKVDAQVIACTGNPMFNGNFLDEDKVVASGYSNPPGFLPSLEITREHPLLLMKVSTKRRQPLHFEFKS